MVKVISLSEEAYKMLKRMKRSGMSFSDIIIENLSTNSKDKTENFKDLAKWVHSLRISGKKEKISTKVDEIIYGVKK